MLTLLFDMWAPDLSALRETQGPYRIFTVDGAAAYMRGGRPLPLLPLCGGVPPDIAWPYLERAVMAANVPDHKEDSCQHR